MALQTSGAISLNEIHIEAGGSSGTTASLNDADIRGLISKSSGAQSSFSEFYGAQGEVVLSSAGNVNGQAQRQEITVSTFISSGETLRIPSTMWVWSDDTATPALTVDIPCTIINEGKIIGKGGAAGTSYIPYATSYDGGPAVKITSSGVTIQNLSGAYIAGGGGGGAGFVAGGGGGGGAGSGGGVYSSNQFNSQTGGAGGALNAKGSDGSFSVPSPVWTGSPSPGTSGIGKGGESGGAGGGFDGAAAYNQGGTTGAYGGGGGGRILPGVAQARLPVSSNNPFTGGSGGGGGQAGNVAANPGGSYGFGGGGWGAAGGGGSFGGDPGAAITATTSYTLSNSGTIYGST